MTRSFTSADDARRRAVGVGERGAPGRGRDRPGRRRTPGEGAAARRDRRDRPDRRSRGIAARRRTAACASARSSTHARHRGERRRSARGSRRSPTPRAIVGSHATRAQGTIGGNVMNASPAMDTGGPLLCFGATATLRSRRGERSIALDELWTGPGGHRPRPTSCWWRSTLLRRPPDRSCYVRLEYRRQMEIAVVGATAVVTLDGGSVRRRAHRDHRAHPDDPPRARGRSGVERERRRRRGGRRELLRRRRRRGDPDQRRPRVGRVPPGDGRGHRAARDRGRARTRRAVATVPIPASPRCTARARSEP